MLLQFCHKISLPIGTVKTQVERSSRTLFNKKREGGGGKEKKKKKEIYYKDFQNQNCKSSKNIINRRKKKYLK